jgi:hypothetical protein
VIIGFAFALLGFAATAIAGAVAHAVRHEDRTREAIRSFVAEPKRAPLPSARMVASRWRRFLAWGGPRVIRGEVRP